MKRRDMLRAAAGLALGFPAIARSSGQDRPIRLIVPFAPGGAVDMLARVFGPILSEALGGRTVVVDNRGGTGGMIGTALLSKSAPDGTTLGIIGVGPLCASPFLFKEMLYDPVKDLKAVSQMVDSPLLCVTNADLARTHGWNTFEAMMAWAKKNPGRFTYGSGGVGGAGHLNFSAICKHLDIDAIHVPYRGGGPLIIDMRAGRVDSTFDGAGAVLTYVKQGLFKPLAVSMPKRFPLLPDVPGLAEFPALDMQDYSVNGWHALMAPGGTPPDIIEPLNEAVQKVLRSEHFRQSVAPMMYVPATQSGPEALARLIQEDTPKFKALVNAADLQPS